VPAGKSRIRVAEGVYLKASGKYLAMYTDPGHKQQWKQHDTEKEARLWRANALVDPSSMVQGKRPLSQIWKTFMEQRGASLRPTTRANWEQEWRLHIEPALGNWPVGKITIPAVKTYLAEMESRSVGAATRQKCRSILYRLFEEALENGEVARNPVAVAGTRVSMPQPKKARVLSPEEVRRVLEAAEKFSSTDVLAIELLFFLGLRIGEAAGLQARDVDLARSEITIARTVTEPGGRLIVHVWPRSGLAQVRQPSRTGHAVA